MIVPPMTNAVVLNAIYQQNKKRDIKGVVIEIGNIVSFHNINQKTGEIKYLYSKVKSFVNEKKAITKVSIKTSKGKHIIKPCNKCRVEDK